MAISRSFRQDVSVFMATCHLSVEKSAYNHITSIGDKMFNQTIDKAVFASEFTKEVIQVFRLAWTKISLLSEDPALASVVVGERPCEGLISAEVDFNMYIVPPQFLVSSGAPVGQSKSVLDASHFVRFALAKDAEISRRPSPPHLDRIQFYFLLRNSKPGVEKIIVVTDGLAAMELFWERTQAKNGSYTYSTSLTETLLQKKRF
jgi:hypothetical protein